MQVTKYCFTLNNPEEMIDWSVDFPLDTIRYAIYQMERGKNGTTHFQGYVQFFRSQRIRFCQNHLPRAHWEPQRATNDNDAVNYCMKRDETYVDGPWTYGSLDTVQGQRTDLEICCDDIRKGMGVREFAIKHEGMNVKYNKNFKAHRRDLEEIVLELPVIQLVDWQIQVLKMIEETPVKRRIIWIWSDESGMGKSTFKDYVAAKYPFDILDASEDMKDTLYLYQKQRIIWFDIPRGKDIDRKMLSQLEKYSDGGLIQSTKYEPRQLVMRAHIVVTSNRSPPYNDLPKRFVEIKAIL